MKYPVETCCPQAPARAHFASCSLSPPIWLVWGRGKIASGPGCHYDQEFLVGKWLNQVADRGNSTWHRNGSDHSPGHLRVRELKSSEPVLFCQKHALCKMLMMGRQGWGLGVGEGHVGKW